MGQIILDFGCGTDRYPNATAIDISDRHLTKEGDIKWDLDNYPYPLSSNYADLIYCSHVIEHLKKPEETLREFTRIIKPMGKIIIKVPHASCLPATTTPVHKHNFTSCTIRPYIELASGMITINGRIDETKKPILKVVHTQLRPHYWNRTRTKSMQWLDMVKIPYRITLYPIFFLINKFPDFYERHFSGIFPIADIKWTLVKEYTIHLEQKRVIE